MTEFYAFADRHPLLVTVWFCLLSLGLCCQPLTLVKVVSRPRSGEKGSGPHP